MRNLCAKIRSNYPKLTYFFLLARKEIIYIFYIFIGELLYLFLRMKPLVFRYRFILLEFSYMLDSRVAACP